MNGAQKKFSRNDSFWHGYSDSTAPHVRRFWRRHVPILLSAVVMLGFLPGAAVPMREGVRAQSDTPVAAVDSRQVAQVKQVPANTPMLRFGDTDRVGGIAADQLVYSNTYPPGDFYYYSSGSADHDCFVADDIALIVAGCNMTSYELVVYGSGGGTFDVDVVLYNGDPCLVASAPILGTVATWIGVPGDGIKHTLTETFDPPVAIPGALYMLVTFSTDSAGWVLGEVAEVGTSADSFAARYDSDDPPDGYCDTCGTVWFLGDPQASFWAEIYCEVPSVGEACCLPPDETCEVMTPEDCRLADGAPLGPGSDCTDPDICQLDEPCEDCGPGDHWVDQCYEGYDRMPTAALAGIDLDDDCVADTNLILHGPATIHRSDPLDDSANFPNLRPTDGHTDVMDTEIVQMYLTGGGVTLRAGGGGGSGGSIAPSLGAIAEQYPQPPGSPALAESFFDVFFEVDLGGGQLAFNPIPLRVANTIDCVPPDTTNYIHVNRCIRLYDYQGVYVANLVAPNHITYPKEEVDYFPRTRAKVEIHTGLGNETIQLVGPSTVLVDLASLGDQEPDGLEEVPTEIVELDLKGYSELLSSPVSVKVRPYTSPPYQRSTGEIEEENNNTDGVLDLPPFTAAGSAFSFFDVFFEITVAGEVYHNVVPKRLEARITEKPPGKGEVYISPADPIDLYYENGELAEIQIVSASHTPRPDYEVDEFPDTKATVEINTPLGSETITVKGPTTVLVDLGSLADEDADGKEEVQTEIVSMNLTGNSSLYGPVVVRVRSDTKPPYRPSTGEIEENENNTDGTLELPPFTQTGSATSFFDVFFEIEVGAEVLHNNEPKRQETTITEKPPAEGEKYENPDVIPLYNEDGTQSGIELASASHTPRPGCEPEPDGLSCKDVDCPDPTEVCIPTKISRYTPPVVFPPGGIDYLAGTGGYITLQNPSGLTEVYDIEEGDPNITVVERQNPIVGDLGNTIEMEIIEMNLVATGADGGIVVEVHQSEYEHSLGEVMGGTSDDFPADSFFDVYVTIDIPQLEVYGLWNWDPISIWAYGIVNIPPGKAWYEPSADFVPVMLLDVYGEPTGWWITWVNHWLPPPPPWTILECECLPTDYCHIVYNPADPTADPWCEGGCPQGQECNMIATDTNGDGIDDEFECRCEDQPLDRVVCEPQTAITTHPPNYWYEVTPGVAGRCDFHVRVYDANPANYTSWSITPWPGTDSACQPTTPWRFGVHEVLPGEWWASWWDTTPDCKCAFFGTTTFQFTNTNPSVWGDWTTTTSNTWNPHLQVFDSSANHTAEPDGYGYRVHVPEATPPKWSQPPMYNADSDRPECFWGWDSQSVYDWAIIVADDFPCDDEKPITDIHWWGSYPGWPEQTPPPNPPIGFHIGIWTNVPANPQDPSPFSHPGQMIHQWTVQLSNLNETLVGCDYHDRWPNVFDYCYRYDYIIPEDQWFEQEPACSIYWISIAAIYGPGGPTAYEWGWKTREHYFEDDAVQIWGPTNPVIGSVFGAGAPIEYPQDVSWDMAFVLTTEACPIADPPTQPVGEAGYPKIRYISMDPGNPGRLTALRVHLKDLPVPFDVLNCTKCWVGQPQQVSENSGNVIPIPGWPNFMSANLQGTPHCMDWSTVGVLHVTDDDIVPAAQPPGGVFDPAIYDVQAIDCDCDFSNEANYSAPLTITTSKWGDSVGHCAVIPCTPPEGVVNMATDVTACFDKFRNLAGAVLKSRADVEPNFPDGLVNISDCTFELDAFRGFAYPPAQTPPAPGWPGPDGCP